MTTATVTTQEAGKPASTASPLADLVDLERYPLGQPDSPKLAEAIEHCRAGLAAEGCAVVPGFIRAERQGDLQAESESLAPDAFFSRQTVNPYSTADDPSLPEDDPRRFHQPFSSGFVTRDRIPEDAIAKRVFHSKAFQAFIAACLGLEEIHEYADPIAGLVINVMPDGSAQPWHFDTNEFIVSLMTRKPDAAGAFEYCPDIRRPENENLPGVKAVLQGDRTQVKSLELQVGDLQIFKGRFALHRVAETRGERHTLLFGYARTPGMIGRPERTRRVFGRVHQAHIDAEKQRRNDGLLD